MQRRTLIQSLFTWFAFQGSRLWGQAASTFPGKHEAALKDLAATVLPESLGRSETDAVATQFIQWVREYRVGAEMQTGYGATRVRYKPDSPSGKYLQQLEQLSSGALAEKDIAARRLKIAEGFKAAKIKDLPAVPDGVSVAADLMTFYFQSSEANDLLYTAAIGKDKCRTLKNSTSMPPSLKKDTTHAAL